MSLTCPQCSWRCKSFSGLRRHQNSLHRDDPGLTIPVTELRREYHPDLNSTYTTIHTTPQFSTATGQRCDRHGASIPQNAPPEVPTIKVDTDWSPFESRAGFELAEFAFADAELSRRKIDKLLELWAATLVRHGDSPPIVNQRDLHRQIDAIELGDVRWENTCLKYEGPCPNTTRPPEWKTAHYDVWHRNPREVIKNMLARPDLEGHIDYTAYREFNGDQRQYSNVMSGNWAWKQSDTIALDPLTHGSMFVPIILGSDKTTVSVATGQNDFYPLYLSIGNIQSHMRRAHKNSLVLIGFLPIPKGARKDTDTEEFWWFKRDLTHRSIATILLPLRPFMKTPNIVLCPDQYFRQALYGLGPHIADYLEQATLAWILFGWCPTCLGYPDSLDAPCRHRSAVHTDILVGLHDEETLRASYGIAPKPMPYTTYFPRADIFEVMTPDLLHQLIKGVYKDHLVDWVGKYLEHVHGTAGGARVIDEIDRRIALAPPFPGLRRFKQGQNFSQWTGDDSKALMKVYMNAIQAFVPPAIVETFAAFLEFCYIARRNIITEDSLRLLNVALGRFHEARQVFAGTIRVEGPSAFSLPRQHSMVHYFDHIKNFGSPNGLCSSITESKHITAVKRPWRRSNKHMALPQMIKSNQRLDKLAAARADFTARGMLVDSCLIKAIEAVLDAMESDENSTLDDDDEASSDDTESESDSELFNNLTDTDAMPSTAPTRSYPTSLDGLGLKIGQHDLLDLTRRFLFYQLNPTSPISPDQLTLTECPMIWGSKTSVYHSATATFRAPSNPSGPGGMYREVIRSTPFWPRGDFPGPRRDCIFVDMGDPGSVGMKGVLVARVYLFFRFSYNRTNYPCALVHWYSTSSELDASTGMWVVHPESTHWGTRHMGVIHLDSIVRGAHLLPKFPSDAPVYREINYMNVLDVYTSFYVNKLIDHHAFEIAF
ncbi:hypothetical protein BJ322DRAFT_1014885 [Thelephora terrestris]|uniref:C2H2-type domain-containing protein n=1 Tax=Thelephora terrestris TaxID=56493 RepID=A0A9P6H5P1_9AGAM|nr:hypothetical protein BJ322DRAFT_1014885 [Thelephora terrestris]